MPLMGARVSTIKRVSADGSHRSPRIATLLIVAGWIAVAVIANVIFALAPPKATDSALLPAQPSAPGRAAKAFPGTGTNAVAYLVVEGRDVLGSDDQQYYDAAVSALRVDTKHVGSVLDWWSDPLTAPMGTGREGRSATALVWLVGEAGSAQARQSLDAARAVVRKLPATGGVQANVQARISVPATTNGMPLHLSAWQGAAIAVVVAMVAALLLWRARRSKKAAGIMLLTAGLSSAVAWPLGGLVLGYLGGNAFTVFAGTLAAVLTIGMVTASTLLARSRGRLPALALPGACTALLTGPLLLARTPALHSVGTAVLGVVVALAASLTLLSVLTGRAAQPSAPTGSAPDTPRAITRSAMVIAAVLAVCALPVIGMRWGLAENPPPAPSSATAQTLPGNPLPDVVLLQSPHDLRDPSGLIAIDQVSHRLMEIPGVRKVQSAAWPAGVPWADASLTSAMGRLSDQLDRGAGSFMPQVNAIKSLGAIVDQMNGAVNELDKSMKVALAGANQIQQNVDVLLSGTRQIRGVTGDLARYMEPVRGWVGGVDNCPADMVCSAVGKVVTHVDTLLGEVTTLTDSADRIGAVTRTTIGAFSSAPRVMADMKSALAKLSTFVPNLETTIENTLPQIVQMSTFLKGVSTDFANTGEGGFYMSKKSLADPSYQHVRQAMFAPDGTVTRLFVYSDGAKLDLDAAARAPSLEVAAGKAMKYGSLLDAKITVAGGAQLGTAVRGAVSHDAVLLGVMLLAAAGLVGMWCGAASGVAVGLGLLASYLAALGISVAVWQHLLGHELHAAVPLVSFAILAACGIPYLVAAAGTVRGAAAPLTALGAIFGAGLILVSAVSVSATSQVGTVLVIGLIALTAVARAWLPVTPRS
jgi:putative drug exporter of the RND superfamily